MTTHNAPSAARTVGTATIGLLAAFAYLVTVGGTGSGELSPALRALNSLIGGALIVVWVTRAPSRADRLDRAVLVALLLFIGAGVVSAFPRQSLDAVLAAMAYAAGLFVAREVLAQPVARTIFVRVLMALSAVMTAIAILFWVPPVIEWWNLTGRTVVPPLDIQLSGGPWGHRYDVALLVALLYPAWWAGRPSVPRRVAAIGIGLLGIMVVLITGSRTLWISLGAATIALAVPALVHLWRRGSRVRIGVMAGLLAAGAVAIVSGAATSILERGTSLATLDFRLSMWGPLTDLWLAHPVAGVGPGSFPWTLQLTSYYDTNSWAPRHPDSVLFQVLPEAGLLGLAAVLVLGAVLLWRIIPAAGPASRWALIAFAVACLGNSPTDFAFLVCVAIGWVAYAVPHRPSVVVDADRPRRPLLRYASFGALGVIALATTATVIGGFFHEAARADVEAGDLDEARTALDRAIAADPGMVLYRRERGALHLIRGDDELAEVDLLQASSQNSSDDLASRTLSIAAEASDDEDLARRALGDALRTQRSDPTNLLLAARRATSDGRIDDAVELLAEVVQSWPTIVASPGWAEMLPPSISTPDLVDRAVARLRRGAPSPEPQADQGIWLAVMSGDAGFLREEIRRASMGEELAQSMAMLIACDPRGGDILDALPTAARRSFIYWDLRVRQSSLSGATDLRSVQVLQIMAGGPQTPASARLTMNPLDENAGYSLDRWGYRRNPISWPSDAVATLPSIYAGRALWQFDPRAAVEAAGIGDRLDQC